MIMEEGNNEYHLWLWTSCSTQAGDHLMYHLHISLGIREELVLELNI